MSRWPMVVVAALLACVVCSSCVGITRRNVVPKAAPSCADYWDRQGLCSA